MCGTGEAKYQPHETRDEARAVYHCRRDGQRLRRLRRGNCTSRLHRLHGYRSTIEEATDDHSDAKSEQHAKGVHLKHGEIRDNKGYECAEITEGAGNFHPVVAVRYWLRRGSFRCHAAGRHGLRRHTMKALAAAVIVLFAGSAAAQEHQHKHGQPYGGMQARAVKALSDQQIADIRAGRGMGLALAAELNGYPGPLHVLELADRIGLSQDQKAKVQRLFDAMKEESVPLGVKLIEQEEELDRLFAARTVTPDTLKASTSAIAATQGHLRESHLKYHLSTAALLTESQIQQYAALRGYQNQHRGGDHGGANHRN